MFRMLLALAVAVAVLAESPAVAGRTWTNDKGDQIEAELVRVSGNIALLNKGGEVVRAPIDRLSQADQEYLGAYKEIRKFRTWTTTSGGEMRARYVKYAGGKVILKVGGDEEEYDLSELSDEDRKLVEDLESLATIEAPSPWDLPNEPETRTWTNSNGKEIEAEYRGLEGDTVVLWFRDREWRFPLSDLSRADQQYVDSMQRPETRASSGGLAGGRNGGMGGRTGVPTAGGSQFNGALGDIRGRMNPGLGGGGNYGAGGGRDFAAEARARHEQAMADSRRQMDEMWDRMNSSSAPSPPSYASTPEPRISSPSFPQARFPEPRVSSPDFSSPRPSTPTPNYTRPTPPMVEQEYIICSSCNHHHPAASFKVGQKCKGCGVRIDLVEDASGKIVEESSSGTARRWGRAARGIIALIVIGGSALGWLGRKMSGG